MSNELYYRGSENYAVAVKNQLQRMESQGIRDANKIAFSIQNMEYGIRSDIRQSTYAIVASQEMLRQTFQQGFDSVNNTLQLGFGMMSAKMDELKGAIYQVGDKICNKLDEIHDIVNNPLLTASRELYRRALKNYQNGYFSEALEDIKQAVEKNKTDYISWELMGEIYLYGAGKFSNVINLDGAEKAFENAAKYINADLSSITETDTPKLEREKLHEIAGFKNFVAKIFFELGYTRFLQSNDLLVEGDEAKSIEMLAKSTANLEDSLKNVLRPLDTMSPESFKDYIHSLSVKESIKKSSSSKEVDEAPKKVAYKVFFYSKILINLAKNKHFQGKDDEALDLISKAIDADSNNALIFSTNKDFELIWSKIDNLIEEKRKFFISKIEEERNKVSKLEFTQEKMNSVLSEYDSIVSGYKDAPFLSLVAIIRNSKWFEFFNGKESEIKHEKELIEGLIEFLDSCPQQVWYTQIDADGKSCIGVLTHDDLIINRFGVHVNRAYLSDLKKENDDLFAVKCSNEVALYLDNIMLSNKSFEAKKAECSKNLKGSFRALLECIKDDLDNQMKTYNLEVIKKLSDALTSYMKIFKKEDELDKKAGKILKIISGIIAVIIVICIIRCVSGN